jgi:hypothetical protein
VIIGDWVQRERRGVPHLVESIVSGDVVTRCGRRMKDETNSNGRLLLVSTSLYVCSVCQG